MVISSDKYFYLSDMKQILFQNWRIEECSGSEFTSVAITIVMWIGILGLILATVIYYAVKIAIVIYH
jgi:hypothetical protein